MREEDLPFSIRKQIENIFRQEERKRNLEEWERKRTAALAAQQQAEKCGCASCRRTALVKWAAYDAQTEITFGPFPNLSKKKRQVNRNPEGDDYSGQE